jgi:bifunctional DNase/RNase
MTPDAHELLPLTIVNFTPQDEQGEVTVILADEMGRELRIPVGACGAQAMMLALKRVRIDRPLTHELLLAIIESLEARVDRLIIDDCSKGVFYARLLLDTADGPVSLDCRPSDGLAMVIRAEVPFFATEMVMAGECVEE